MNQTGDGYLIISDENLIMATAAEQQHMTEEFVNCTVEKLFVVINAVKLFGNVL